MTEWKNLRAIQKDLLRAQGFTSIKIGRTIGCDERPPAEVYEEETEEEFFESCITDGDFTQPDLHLIKDMLNLVELSEPSPEEDVEDDLVVIKNNSNSESIPKNPTPKKRKNRNVAIQSLLEIAGEANIKLDSADSNDCKMIKTQNELKMDLTQHKSIDELLHNGLAILESSEPGSSVNKNKIDFKKKDFKANGLRDDGATNTHKDFVKSDPSKMFKSRNKKISDALKADDNEPIINDKVYKPSDLARECYQKYKEREATKTVVKDVWTEAEEKMKVIDARKKLEAEEKAKEDDDLFDAHPYKLPLHRHIWSDVCVICEMMKKHNYDVQSMTECNQLVELPVFLDRKIEQTNQE